MQAVILAAGMGKRLKSLTANNTKCMVKVNGVTLIERMLRQLDRLKLRRIVIVVGYQGQKLIDFISTLDVETPIEYIDNPIYDKTNNIYSLALARSALAEDDTLLLESDLIFADGTLEALVSDPYPTLALVDRYESWMDGTVVTLNEDNSIRKFIPGKQFRFEDIPGYYKTVNIYKFSRRFSKDIYVPFLTAYSSALGDNEYYEQVLRVIAMLDHPEIRAKCMDGRIWYEIDDIQDLDIAESMFASPEEKVEKLGSRYGGYWRYPKLLDFCYLVNPYFPPKRLMDEIKANFETLLTQYPSGMRVNSLLAAKDFGVKQEHILVGNGAAELIKALMEGETGKVGFVRPTFEEYYNRCNPAQRVVYRPEGFTYTADDLMREFSGKGISTLLLINPDNPSGSYLLKAEVCRLADWAETEGIRLVLDESFADFSDELDNTLILDEMLEHYPHLVVVKSISKSYGVPGLRLGVLASADEAMIAAMKKDVAIWNINSFAEFYLQIEEKYKKDYALALEKFRAARAEYVAALRDVPGLRVLPSQANYVMAELTGGITAAELTARLLSEYNILIKDLTAKVQGGQYIRLAVRDEKDNARLVQALRTVCGGALEGKNP